MPNRLIDSTSPYLLQHAHNPVNWFPWGAEALERARTSDLPIFLSVGYSACHWCHVMEHESFEDEATARLLNDRFVAIKADREERPDLDEIYMMAVQLLTGRGGWPMSVFLTPDLEPFHAGTYFPPRDSLGMPGFCRVLTAAADAYQSKRESVQRAAGEVADAIRKATALGTGEGGVAPAAAIVERVLSRLERTFDARWGGFGPAPKFPPSQALMLLLRRAELDRDRTASMMAERTLGAMARGGLFDQLGGGFHRYSVDERWLVPHFEKMLYDNAQLAAVYLEAARIIGDPFFERVARETLEFMLRELRDEAGGFASALDADTDGAEGKFYVWTPAEVAAALDPDDAAFVARCLGINEAGNFEGSNVLHLPQPLLRIAERENLTVVELLARLDGLKPALLQARAARTPPARDDKVLADWNALAISAFAAAYRVLGDERYRQVAEEAASFVLTRMTTAADGLLHAWRQGRGHTPAFLDDHAFLLAALLDLHDATSDARWLEHARSVAEQLLELFWDADAGGFFSTRAHQADLIARTKGTGGGPTPSGNAVAARSLVRLALLDGNAEYRAKAKATLDAFAGALAREPAAMPTMALAMDEYLAVTLDGSV